jgi:predicted outer membrane repeat protein
LKAKGLFLGVIVSSGLVFSLFAFAAVERAVRTNGISQKAAVDNLSPYQLLLDSSHHSAEGIQDGRLSARTGLGNEIVFLAEKCSSVPEKWGCLESGGSFSNAFADIGDHSNAFSGLLSITVDYSSDNPEGSLLVSYGWHSGYEFFGKPLASGVPFDFGDYGPSYFKIETSDKTGSNYEIDRIDIRYSCSATLPHQHVFGEWVVVQEPTFDSPGSRYRVCEECGEVVYETMPQKEVAYIISILNHDGTYSYERVDSTGSYCLEDPSRNGFSFDGWVDSQNNPFPSTGTISSDVSISARWIPVEVSTIEDLLEAAAAGKSSIKILNDIIVDRTIYVKGKVSLVAGEDVTLLRDPDFAEEMFVVGEDEEFTDLLVERDMETSLSIGYGQEQDGCGGTIVIDGNKSNMNVDVAGSAILSSYGASLNLGEKAVLQNCKKVANHRTLVAGYPLTEQTKRSIGGAAICNLSGLTTIDGGVFQNNEVNTENIVIPIDEETSYSYYSGLGGAIFNYSTLNINAGVFDSNQSCRGGAIFNSRRTRVLSGTFENNYASANGGALSFTNTAASELIIGDEGYDSLDETMVVFRSNRAGNGGAIFGSYYNAIQIYGAAGFCENIATSSGGAVYTTGTLTVSNSLFSENTSGRYGGAIYAAYNTEDSTRRLIDVANCEISHNAALSGGGLYLLGCRPTINGTVISNNVATNNGGGIYAGRNDKTEKSVDMSLSNVEVSMNSAGEGGGLYLDNKCTVNIKSGQFTSNSATGNGGGVSIHGGSVVMYSGSGAYLAMVNNNTAGGNGGGIYVSYRTEEDGSKVDGYISFNWGQVIGNNATGNGGGVYSTTGNAGATTYFFKTITFRSNEAGGNGGALCALNSNGTIENSTLDSNSCSQDGGAVYLSNSSLTATNITAHDNQSSHYGGVFSLSAASVLTINGGSYYGNSADLGGVMYVNRSSASVLGTSSAHVSFGAQNSPNTARNGGAIYSSTNAIINVSYADLCFNNASSHGGALFASHSSEVSLENVVASSNVAKSGGALYVNDQASVTISSSSLSNNQALTGNGGAVFLEGSSLNVSSSSFVSNSAAGKGGAISAAKTVTQVDEEDVVTISHLEISSSSFTTNSSTEGGAIYILELNELDVRSCVFEENSSSGNGGALSSHGAIVTITDQSSFESNHADGNGGALYISYTSSGSYDSRFEVSDTSFSLNGADGNGGAIYGTAVSSLAETLNLGNCEFASNSASLGGAVFVNSSTVSISESTFSDNCATTSGGSLYGNGSAFAIDGTSFTGNSAGSSGGAIYANNTVLTITSSSFEDNAADNMGGAIYMSGNRSSSIAESSFANNRTTTTTFSDNNGNGGAVFTTSSTSLTFTSCLFDGNVATHYGGAISSHGNSTIVFDGCSFDNNNAVYGGVAYVHTTTMSFTSQSGQSHIGSENNGNTATRGAAIYASTKSTVYFDGVEVSYNVSNREGAAIFAGGTGSNVSVSNCVISHNSSTLGPVYYTGDSGATLTINGGSVVSYNVASSDGGGAIHINGNSVNLFVDHASFTHNTAKNGGVMYITGGNVHVSNSSFSSNSATGGGGVFFLSDATTSETILEVQDSEFISNSAVGGGVMRTNGSASIEFDGCSFSSNYSSSHGGVFHLYSVEEDSSRVVVLLNDCVFTNNGAKTNGGSLYVSNFAETTLNACTFVQNYVESSSGNGAIAYVASSGHADFAGITLDSTNSSTNLIAYSGSKNVLIRIKSDAVVNTDDNSYTAADLYRSPSVYVTEYCS